jgi:hypothetical protein
LGGGSPPAPPLLVTKALGAEASFPIGASSSSAWADRGASWNVSMSLEESLSERWMTNQDVQGVIASPLNLSLVYFHQYLVNASYSMATNPSVLPVSGWPVVEGTQLGASLVAPFNGTTYQQLWLDSGTTWSVSNSSYSVDGAQRWVTGSVTFGTVGASTIIEPVFHRQYLLTISISPDGGGVASPQGGWVNATGNVTLTAVPAQGWGLGTWEGTGDSSYSGDQNPITLTMTSPVSEEAIFYPSLNLTVEGGGVITVTATGKGVSVQGGASSVLYFQQGAPISLEASPFSFFFKFTGWSGGVSGSAPGRSFSLDAPTSVTATFAVDWFRVAFVVGAIPVALLLAYMLIRRRPASPPQAAFSQSET